MEENELTPQKDKAEKTNSRKEIYEWLQCVVVALIACVLVFVFVARVIDVVGTSMVPTLQDGDKIIITRLVSEYKQGDIVVLQKDAFRDEPIVKRIIAVGGQTIDIDFETGTVRVRNTADPDEDAYWTVLDEPYINEITLRPEDFTGPVDVPEGCVFVMGDNRNNSTDSRDARIGCVDTRNIMGKVIFRILPLSSIGAVYS